MPTGPAKYIDSAPEGYISVSVARQRKGVSRDHVVEAIKKGILEGVQVGIFWFVKESSLWKWVPNRRGRPSKD